MAKGFQTTRWSVVLRAGAQDGADSREALAELCEAYWVPVYGFFRGQGHAAEDARDLTQAYFAELLDKGFLRDLKPASGRFRSFLLVSMRHFLSHERDRARAMKRGGGTSPVPLDAGDAERLIALDRSGELSPERSFEIRWAQTVVRRSMLRLEKEFADAGQSERLNLLRGFLMDDAPTPSYRELAERLGQSENGVKSMVLRLRKRFGVALRAEVAQTVANPEQTDEELRHLLHALESR